MPSQRIREHFMSQFRLLRIYEVPEISSTYAVFIHSGQTAWKSKGFTDIPVGTYVVHLEHGIYFAWRKVRTDSSRRAVWRELPQWKADLLGLITYPLLRDDGE